MSGCVRLLAGSFRTDPGQGEASELFLRPLALLDGYRAVLHLLGWGKPNAPKVEMTENGE
jgi:hypothetical protein